MITDLEAEDNGTVNQDGTAEPKGASDAFQYGENETDDDDDSSQEAMKLGRRARKRLNQQKWGPINEAKKKAEMEAAANEMISKDVHGILDQIAAGMKQLGQREFSFDAIKSEVSAITELNTYFVMQSLKVA